MTLSETLKEFYEYAGSDYTIMVVGHEPFMSDLAFFVLKRSFTFDTGTLLEMSSYNPEKAWDLCFYVQARHLSRLFSGGDT